MNQRDRVVETASRIADLKQQLAIAEAELDSLLGQTVGPSPARRQEAAPTKQSSALKRPQVSALVKEILTKAGPEGLLWSELEEQAGGRERSVAARSALKNLVKRGEAARNNATDRWHITKKKAPKA